MNGASKLCEGCLRTIDEIASWGGISEQEKLMVCDAIEHRKVALAGLSAGAEEGSHDAGKNLESEAVNGHLSSRAYKR
jgi:predicted Fe-S protein YdhL (DUF1289 family)